MSNPSPSVNVRLARASAFGGLAVFLLTAALWARSHLVGDMWRWNRDLDQFEAKGNLAVAVYAFDGQLSFLIFRTPVVNPRSIATAKSLANQGIVTPRFQYDRNPTRAFHVPSSDPSYRRPLSVLGFERHVWVYVPGRYEGNISPTIVPLGFPMLLIGGATALLWRRFIVLARRKGAGHCQHCGYDMRASPARCPECGMTPKTAGRGNLQVNA